MEIPVFRPDISEFGNFMNYIRLMEANGAHKIGLAKVIPPKESPLSKLILDEKKMRNVKIKQYEQQKFILHNGNEVVSSFHEVCNETKTFKRSKSYKAFRDFCNSEEHQALECSNLDDPANFFDNLELRESILVPDLLGTLFDDNLNANDWNVSKVNGILGEMHKFLNCSIEGVTHSMLYFGTKSSCVAWHLDDMDLPAINYLHFGERNIWHCIPPREAGKLEKLASELMPWEDCKNFLRHKSCLPSPDLLKKRGITCKKIVQEAGEIIVTFPRSYRFYYSQGLNCSESTNFATERWVPFGANAKFCSCEGDIVKFNMDPFIKKYMPDSYEEWERTRAIQFDYDEYEPPCLAHSEDSLSVNESSGAAAISSSWGNDATSAVIYLDESPGHTKGDKTLRSVSPPATPTSTPQQSSPNAATPTCSKVMGMATQTAGKLQAYRSEREIDERNNPPLDEELDAMFPPGHKDLQAAAVQSTIFNAEAVESQPDHNDRALRSRETPSQDKTPMTERETPGHNSRWAETPRTDRVTGDLIQETHTPLASERGSRRDETAPNQMLGSMTPQTPATPSLTPHQSSMMTPNAATPTGSKAMGMATPTPGHLMSGEELEVSFSRNKVMQAPAVQSLEASQSSGRQAHNTRHLGGTSNVVKPKYTAGARVLVYHIETKQYLPATVLAYSDEPDINQRYKYHVVYADKSEEEVDDCDIKRPISDKD